MQRDVPAGSPSEYADGRLSRRRRRLGGRLLVEEMLSSISGAGLVSYIWAPGVGLPIALRECCAGRAYISSCNAGATSPASSCLLAIAIESLTASGLEWGFVDLQQARLGGRRDCGKPVQENDSRTGFFDNSENSGFVGRKNRETDRGALPT